ncbi:hypothetical protein GF351_01380 [Candidatus Woesearchaeota archaeon]|nr:hypothetical protein [Candidatus Woesearchaeota archaeon]
MGRILSSRLRDDGKVVFEVCVDYDEAISLNGHMENVHLFSDNTALTKTNMSERGRNEATKYFLIPKQLRENIKFNQEVSCQKLETGSRIMFIYSFMKHK